MKLGLLQRADCDRILGVLRSLGFDLTPPVGMERLLAAVEKDKKRENDLLPVGTGDCEVRGMSMAEFAALFV